MVSRSQLPVSMKGILAALLVSALILMGGCASKSPSPAAPSPGAKPAAIKISPATGKAGKILRTARSLIGAPYKWGGTSPRTGFDCSGFVWFVYHQNGINLPRVSWQQFGAGSPIKYSQLRPGDLVFHKVDKNGKSLHVGIVTDRGTFIHAPSSGKRVMESSMNNVYWREHYIGSRRVL